MMALLLSSTAMSASRLVSGLSLRAALHAKSPQSLLAVERLQDERRWRHSTDKATLPKSPTTSQRNLGSIARIGRYV